MAITISGSGIVEANIQHRHQNTGKRFLILISGIHYLKDLSMI